MLKPPALQQNQLSQVSFMGIFKATTPPHNFLAATLQLGRFESLMFVVELLANSAVVCIATLLCFKHAQQFHISHFSYHLRYYMINDYC